MAPKSWNRGPAVLRGVYVLAWACNNRGQKKLETWTGGAGTTVRRSCEGDDPSAGCCNRGLRELEPCSDGAAGQRSLMAGCCNANRLDVGTISSVCWNQHLDMLEP